MRFTERDGLSLPLSILGGISGEKLFIIGHNTSETSVLEINKLDSANQPVTVAIKNLLINNQDIDFNNPDSLVKRRLTFEKGKLFYNLPVNPRLSHDQSNLVFQFVPVGEYANGELLFSYKLEGLDEGWSVPSEEPAARYPYLPPGHYTLAVRVLNRQQQWGPSALYSFVIQPPFWKEWWFVALIFILVSLSVYRLVSLRINSIRQRELEKTAAQQKITELEYKGKQGVMNERLRISAELHDEVGATLSGIAMYSHLAKEQLNDPVGSILSNSLDIIQQNAGEMVNKLNDIVWLINPGNDNLQQLLQRLEDYTVQMAAVKGIRVKSNINGHHSQAVLPAETRRNIYLLFKEAVNNAVKYSQATLFEFVISEEPKGITISFIDNGKGFDREVVKNGNGLHNMQKRAGEIGADLQYVTVPGTGVKLVLHLPQ